MSRRARRTSERWPSCSAPIVGTRPSEAPRGTTPSACRVRVRVRVRVKVRVKVRVRVRLGLRLRLG